jgi:hypothetical protein
MRIVIRERNYLVVENEGIGDMYSYDTHAARCTEVGYVVAESLYDFNDKKFTCSRTTANHIRRFTCMTTAEIAEKCLPMYDGGASCQP